MKSKKKKSNKTKVSGALKQQEPVDSFLGLFDPSLQNEVPSGDDEELDFLVQLPPEPQLGNVEYKLKLVNPTHQRFEHLVTQMKWRLREGNGEAFYEIGVEDSGVLMGLSQYELEESLKTLHNMATELGATVTLLRERVVNLENGNDRKVAEVLVRKIPDDQHSIEVRMAVVGNADGGKSTLLGVLTQGELDNGRGRARLNMFRHLHEIQSGRTSSISHEILGFDSTGNVINYSNCSTPEEICESSCKLISFIDLAGHQKYLRTTILGLTGYSPNYIMLVVSASTGIVNMTKEHLALSVALEVPLIVVVTKVDITPRHVLQQTLENLEGMLKAPGYKKVPLHVKTEDDVINLGSTHLEESVVPIFCVSNVTGHGFDLLQKLLYVLPAGVATKEKERLEQEPCEFQIDETFRVPEVGTVVGGLLKKGVMSEGARMLIGPLLNGEFSQVSIQSIHRNRTPCRVVRAGQSASLRLNVPVPGLRKGMVVVSPDTQPSSCIFFQANICVLYHTTAITRGFETTLHIGNVRQTAAVEAIMCSNELRMSERSSVIFRFLRQPEYLTPGARLIFRDGKSRGIGHVTQVFPISDLLELPSR